jgi:oxygen-independent coproporphyrinogen III oxidase
VAGIYIHIPFCRKKCYYCDFYKTTALRKKVLFPAALFRETEQRALYLNDEAIETIYLGGGTPSVLTAGEITDFLHHLDKTFNVIPTAEITMEANPDDLSPDYLAKLRYSGINRLSIGIQSFSDQDLKQMNRRHDALQAVHSVHDAAKAEFSDISIDLIYGLPGLSKQQWKKNLQIAVSLPVNHISAYHLTYHEGTPFYLWRKKGLLTELSEDESIAQFEELIEITEKAGFEQYEISSFARNQAYSKHNCSYWQGKKYLGLGPSAHSFNGISRQWNIADIDRYIQVVLSGQPVFESEILTERDKLNDYLITGIRTKWGISTDYIRFFFGEENYRKIDISTAFYLENGFLKRVGEAIVLTTKGMMVSDQIMLALLID